MICSSNKFDILQQINERNLPLYPINTANHTVINNIYMYLYTYMYIYTLATFIILVQIIINTFVSQRLVFEETNESFLIENALKLTNEFLYEKKYL